MQPNELELEETNRHLPDNEIASLFADEASLTDAARIALESEIKRRGISKEHLLKLHSSDLRDEANFDRREKVRRKGTLFYILFRGDPKGTLVAIIVFLLAVLALELISRFR